MNENGDRKVGQFVTNKWLVGALMALLMSMGGYIFHGLDRGTEASASQLSALERRIAVLEIEQATQRTTLALQYGEIIRRLDRLDSLYGNGNGRRSQAP